MSLLDLDFDAELPDPRAALDRMMADKERKEKAAALKAIKERALRAASAPSRPLRSGSIVPPATRKEVLSDGDSDIEIYRAVVQPEHKPALGAAQSPPMSSDRNKARVDKLFRTLGVKPKTPHKANRPKGVRANANGSPGASSEHFGSDDLAAEDWVTDSQLFAASKTFGVASAIASGHRPPPSHSRHVRAKESTPAVEGPPPDENKGEPTAAEHRTTRRRGAIAMTRDQLNATVLKKAQLQNIKVRAKKEEVATSRRGRTQNAAPKEEETPTSAGPDVAEMLRKVQANADIDEGPDEDGDEDEDDPDFIMPQIEDAAEALGSGSDGPDVEDEAGSGASDAESEKENEEEEGDSEKENVSPQTSQQSQRQLSSRALMDEDEDEAPGMLASRRARGRAIFSDDEDDAPARRELPPLSNSQERALRPLRTSGAYSSGTQSQPLEVGGLMSPAASPDPDRRLRAVSAEPSPPGPQGFTQFFQPTPPETEAAAVQRASGHSVFGQFFEPTQVPDATGSGRAAAGASPPVGFTQLFADGIPLLSKSGDRRDSASGDAPDAFAQLREAQQIGGLVDSPSVLPSLNISAADLEGDEGALMRGEQARKRATKQYLNKDGFFTQTRPTTLFDSQPQSQSQIDWEAQRPGEPSAPRSDARLMTSSSRMSPTQAPTPSMAESPRSPSQRKLMRLVRRPAPPPTSEDGKNESKEDAASDVEESEHEGGEQTPEDEVEDAEDDFQPAQGQQLPSAWDILRRGAANPLPVKNADKRKDRFNFVEGEAVESDDEEGPVGRGGGGGLRGVWSDDDADSVRGSGDEEDGSDDDRDLEGLVHDEHEDDEIAKDRLARERYQ